MTTTPSDDSQSPAERLYHDFAAKRERGEAGPSDFEALCAAHPQLSDELRALASRDIAARELLAPEESLAPENPASAPEDEFFRRLRLGLRGRPSKATREYQPGERIGDYELVRFIGHGGMGQVWEAQQLSLRRRVALKFILVGAPDEQSLNLFEREARAGGKASHPNLVRTLAHGEAGGVQYIAQELVDGAISLLDAIEGFRRESVLPPGYYARVGQWVRDIALGMQAAHDAGVVHRDLKPQNILIDQRGTPRVVDFGLARLLQEQTLARSGEIRGTIHYMSPEQVSAEKSIDGRTDVFSLGVILYELLTLQRPFTGDTTQQIAAQIALFDPPDPRTIRSQCPKDLAVICAKAMQKRSGARYGSMREFAEDLERHLKHEEILAKPATRVEKVRKWVLRHPAQAVGIGVGSTALVVISGLALYAQGQASEATAQAQRAEKGERAAKDNLVLAEKNADEARRNAEQAQQARDDGRLNYAQRLFDYRREQLERLSDTIKPAVGLYYEANRLRVWIDQNKENRENARFVETSFAEVYSRWEVLQADLVRMKDPVGTIALLKGLCRENSQAIAPLDTLLLTFDIMTTCSTQEDLRQQLSQANAAVSAAATALASDLRNEMNAIHTLSQTTSK